MYYQISVFIHSTGTFYKQQVWIKQYLNATSKAITTVSKRRQPAWFDGLNKNKNSEV